MMIFVGIMIAVAVSTLQRKKYNLPGLITTEMGLLLPVLLDALDHAHVVSPDLAGLVALVYIPGLLCYICATIICAAFSVLTFLNDRDKGGMLGTVISLVLVFGIGFIAKTNFLAAMQNAQLHQAR